MEIGRAAGYTGMVALARSNLVSILVALGRLHEAARAYADALALATPSDPRLRPWAGHVYAGLGRLQYEWNQLDSAAQSIQQCIEIGQQGEASSC